MVKSLLVGGLVINNSVFWPPAGSMIINLLPMAHMNHIGVDILFLLQVPLVDSVLWGYFNFCFFFLSPGNSRMVVYTRISLISVYVETSKDRKRTSRNQVKFRGSPALKIPQKQKPAKCPSASRGAWLWKNESAGLNDKNPTCVCSCFSLSFQVTFLFKSAAIFWKPPQSIPTPKKKIAASTFNNSWRKKTFPRRKKTRSFGCRPPIELVRIDHHFQWRSLQIWVLRIRICCIVCSYSGRHYHVETPHTQMAGSIVFRRSQKL